MKNSSSDRFLYGESGKNARDAIRIAVTVTMPAQLGQSVTVTCALDDTPTALLPGTGGSARRDRDARRRSPDPKPDLDRARGRPQPSRPQPQRHPRRRGRGRGRAYPYTHCGAPGAHAYADNATAHDAAGRFPPVLARSQARRRDQRHGQFSERHHRRAGRGSAHHQGRREGARKSRRE